MLVITANHPRETDPGKDELGRTCVGWSPQMNPDEVFQATRGCWRLHVRKAKRERYALIVAQGVVRIAIEIHGFKQYGDRHAIEGDLLQAGHPVHDTYVGKPDPVPGQRRNPVRYWDASSVGVCACGCGEEVTGSPFRPGHDQKAIHDRIKSRFRNVQEFLEWFDENAPSGHDESNREVEGAGT